MKYSYRIKDYHIPYKNLYDMLVGTAERYPEKIAVIDDHESVTYLQLVRRVDLMAETFHSSYHMKEGDQAGVLMLNTVNMVAVIYALMKLGCIAVLINTKFRSFEIQNLLDEMEIRIMLSDACWSDKVSDYLIQRGIPLLTEKDQFAIDSGTLVHTKAVPHPDDVAVIMHTSGTTGRPKGVMVTQRNIMEAVYGYAEVQGLGYKDVAVVSTPIFHILALAGITAYMMFIGATEVLSDYYNVDVIIDKIRQYHATHFHSVPTIFQQIVESPRTDKDLSSLKIAVCGGAKVSDEVVEEFCRIAPNARFTRAYGLTETAGSGALSLKHKEPLRTVPNVYCTVVDTQHREIKPGEIGEIVICGPCVARGRWKAEPLPDECEYTGDIGYIDHAGYIYIIDRLKDLINRGGEKIFPMLVEEVILKYPGIKEASVYAVGSREYGEIPYAAIIIEEGAAVDCKQLQQYVRKHVATYETPVHFDIVEDFPRTQNGKVRKIELRRRAEEKLRPN